MTKQQNRLFVFTAALLGLPLLCMAQQAGQQGQPVGQQKDQTQGGQHSQPPTPVSAEAPTQGADEGQATAMPTDARSFGGAEGFAVKGPVGTRGFFFPSFQFSAMGDSDTSVTSGLQSFESVESLVGRLDYVRSSRREQTTLEYMGGATIFNKHSEFNTTMHEFGITQAYQGRRWSLTLDERASYIPESSFGYGGFGFMGALGTGLGGALGSILPTLDPRVSTNSGLLTGRGSRIYNTTLVQVQYLAGRRSSLNLSASYDFLHFNGSGPLNSRNGNLMLGYSHSISATDFIGINYAFQEFRYPGAGTSFETHGISASYGHRISGRLAMQVGAGPQINVYRKVANGSSNPLSWFLNSSLNYQARRGALAAYYYRTMTSGGGVLPGATSDNVTLSWSTELMRRWSCSLGPGFSRNRSIPQTTAGLPRQTFNTEYASASLSRMIGRYTSMFVTYTFQTQSALTSPCPFSTCGESLQRHVVGFGFDFHPRQISSF